MYLLRVLVVLVVSIIVDGYRYVHWIEADCLCPRKYGPDDYCIHYSNCDNGGLSKGHPEFCYFSTRGVAVLCCIENAKQEKNNTYGKPHKTDKENTYQPPPYQWQQSATTSKPTTSTVKQPDYAIPPYSFTSKPPSPSFGITHNGDRSGVQNIQNAVLPLSQPGLLNRASLRKCKGYFRQAPLLNGPDTPTVGGKPAKPTDFPHLALLGFGAENNIQWLCSGTLISEQYVLTAAHCLFHRGFGPVRYIRLGELDLSSATEDVQKQDYTVSEAIAHPQYKGGVNYHNIALLRMNASIPSVSYYVRPACVGATRNVNPTATLVSAGWGLTEPGGDPSAMLLKTALKLVSNERCRRIYGTPRNMKEGIIDEVQVCADEGREKRDSCQGDLGGPLQYTNYDHNSEFGGFVEVIGITSFGQACGLTPGIYTRVLPFVSWIEAIVWPN